MNDDEDIYRLMFRDLIARNSKSLDEVVEDVGIKMHAAGMKYMTITITGYPGHFWDSAEVKGYIDPMDCSPDLQDDHPTVIGTTGGGGTAGGALTSALSSMEAPTRGLN